MNSAEKILINEKFEEVIMAIPDLVYTGNKAEDPIVLTKAVEAFRKIMKAL